MATPPVVPGPSSSRPPVFSENAGGPRRIPFLPGSTFFGFMVAVLAVLVIFAFSMRAARSRADTSEQITRSFEVSQQLAGILSTLKDAETGQRGYLLTDGIESYLLPYEQARSELDGKVRALRRTLEAEPHQQQQLDTIGKLAADKMAELGETISLHRGGNHAAALNLVRTDRGKNVMDRIRRVMGEMESEEAASLQRRQQQWQADTEFANLVTTAGGAVLLALIIAAMVMTSRDFRAREAQAWIRGGQMGLSAKLQGDQRLEVLGRNVMSFLAEYLGAQVGAVYLSEDADRFRRFGGYALPAGSAPDVLAPGEGLLGQAAREQRVLRVTDVPPDYLPMSSSVGKARVRELLLAPAVADGVVQAVVELGFLRTLDGPTEELLSRASEILAVAVRTSKDRTRLDEMLEETQRQAEELQAQQEELRVSNEELEEQGQVLKESQARLESQHAELEEINAQLASQADTLEQQKDELERAQGVLTEKSQELERSNQYKSEFLANMSHELRTPLNSSLILAKLLADNKDANLTEEQVKYAQTISSAGNDLLALINDILDLSKIESGKVEIESEVVAVERVADGIIKAMQPLADQKGLGFSMTVEPGTPEKMETDAQRLGQILRNLLSNALKFTEKGEVTLRVCADGDGLAFIVRDTGIGIPFAQQEIIFEAFRQADGSTHRKYGGTGLGLSISRDLARLLGGDLRVQSTQGQGSTFTLTLPRVYAAAQPGSTPLKNPRPSAPVSAPAPRLPPRLETERAAAEISTSTSAEPRRAPAVPDDRDRLKSGGRTILVIEDDHHFAAILRDLARELGFLAIVCDRAGEGLEAAVRYRPSAILLDMNLPDHSGLAVLDQLKRTPATRHIPVHVASVADYSQEALERGAVGYALKPVKREELVEAFAKLETKLAPGVRRVLVIEDDPRQRDSVRELLQSESVEIVGVATATEGLNQLQTATFDCVVMDFNLPDLSATQLLEKMAERDDVSFPPVIVYTGRSLTRSEEQQLRRFSRSIIIKDARSPERLLDEVTLFLHQVEAQLPPDRQKMLREARSRESALEGRRILVVEDDVRNIFALSSVLEPKGAKVQIARNGREALDALAKLQSSPETAVDLVLMDIMMPEMDGLTAMREIRKKPDWQKLPIIALTAKAMRDDQEKCIAAGANDYVAKPLDVEKLLSLIRVWMPK